MADFHQSGVITTLHRLGSPDVDRLESELLTYSQQTDRERFMAPEHREMLLVSDEPEELLEILNAYQPFAVAKWLDREEQL